jgi:RNA polymerase sigma factor (sigma-70 family)
MTSKTNDVPSRAANNIHSVYLRYRSLLARAISRIVKPTDIDDILQETFIRAYVAADKTEIRHPRSFMLKTARNLALNHVTSAYSTRVDVADFGDEDVHLSSRSDAVESQCDSQERFLIFCRAVRSLPEQCRRVFILKKVYGFSQQEISKYLGISESTVEKHVAKGLSMCREAVDAMEKKQSRPDASGGSGSSGATRG